MQSSNSSPAAGASSGKEQRNSARTSDAQDQNSHHVNDELPWEENIEEHLVDWLNPETGETVQAIHHDDYRAKFVEQQSLLGEYEYEPASGSQPYDVTCYHIDYEHSGPERPYWPRILYQFRPDDNIPDKTKPDMLYTHEGYVVLNNENVPLLDFPAVPLTISSECEGWRLEALCRSTKWVTMKQLRSRMPRHIHVRLASLSMRMTRFRRKAGAITWDPTGEASDAIEAYICRKLPQACKATNSIEGFRNLYSHEIAEMELESLGRFPKRQKGRKDMSIAKHRAMHKAGLKNYYRRLARDKADYPDVSFGDRVPDGLEYEDEENQVRNGEESSQGRKRSEGEDAEIETPQGHSDMSEGNSQEDQDYSVTMTGSTSNDNQTPEEGQLIELLDGEHEQSASGNAESIEGSERKVASGKEESSKSSSIEGSDSKAGSFLYEDPTTEAELQLIQRLLIPTLRRYRQLVGLNPPVTDETKCYIHQWGDIQTALKKDWYPFAPGDPVPRLIGAVRFDAEKLFWNLPWNNRYYGERLDLTGLAGMVFRERAVRARR